jgi:hypothetical protein
MNKFAIFFVTLCVLAIASAQYFSSSDGINLPRNGKRSYLGYYLNMKEPSNELFDNAQEKFQQTDKLSFRKKFGKYGKRSGVAATSNDELEVSDFDRFNQDADNLKLKSLIELLNNMEEKQQHDTQQNQNNVERK